MIVAIHRLRLLELVAMGASRPTVKSPGRRFPALRAIRR